MYFFLNQYIMALNSGLEHAEMKRQALFKKKGVASRIVTRDYDRSLHRNAAEFGLDQDDLVNMYDFFQDSVTVTPQKLTTKSLNLPIAYQVSPDNNLSQVYEGDRLVLNIHHTPGRVGELFFTEYFDEYGNVTNRVLYDSRGFKSSEQFLNGDGVVYAEIFFKPDGTRAIERYYEKLPDSKAAPIIFNIRLINYQGRDYYFNSEADFFTFFLDELNQSEGGNNVFIADRPAIANMPMIEMKTPARKLIWFPILHAVSPADQVDSELDGNYKVALSSHLNDIDGLITMTEAQARQLRTRLHDDHLPIYVINGAPVSTKQLRKKKLPAVNRVGSKVLYVGRLDASKGVDNLIRAFALVARQVPEARLDIRGYGSTDYVKLLENLIKDLKLNDKVAISGYTSKIDDVYDTAKVFATATKQDAFPLAMVEALSHGLPLIAFDVNYGPKEIIENGQNGYLLKDGDIYNLAQRMIELLKDPAQLEAMSENAYQSAKRYSMTKIWQQWQQLQKTLATQPT